jgi:hypothetical protein
MKTKKYPLETYSQEHDSDIIYVRFDKNLKVDLPTAQKLVLNRLAFTENKKHYLIIDFSNIILVTPEAKTYMQSHEGGLKNVIAAAFFASNHISALLANIFVKTPNITSAFLQNEKDALVWIEELKQKTELRNK